MSKNLTRKGLAIGAIVALGSSLFAGTPASAAGLSENKVTLATGDGVAVYGTTLASNFTLAANNADSLNTSGKYIKFLVTDATKQVMYAVNNAVGSAGTASTTPTYEADGSFVAATTNDGSVNGDAGLALKLPSTVTATTAVKVQAWYDTDGNDEIGATEQVSPVQTVTFYKTADISATVTLTAPAVGDTYLKGSITAFTPALHPAYSTNVDVQFYQHGSATAAAGTATYNTTDKVWYTTTDSTVTTVAEGRTYGVEAMVGTTAVGTRVNKTVAATTVAADGVTTSIVPSADVNAAGSMRLTSSTAVIRAALTDANGAALPAGIPVKFIPTITGSQTIKINGVSTATTVAAYAETNASGVAEITVVFGGAAVAGNNVSFAISAQGVSGTTRVLTYAARQYSIVEDKDVNNSSHRAIAAGGSYSLGVSVVDQWGNALTSASDTYGIKTVLTGRTTGTTYTALSAGKATMTIADGNITGQTAITVELDIVKKDGSSWAAHGLTSPVVWSATNADATADEKRVIAVYAAAAYSVSATSSDKTQNIDADAVATVDSRFDNKPVAAYDDTNSRVTISGNTGVAGAEVTLTGAGLTFLATTGATKSSIGSITVFSGASGAYSVDVVSNKVVSDAVVTVTSMGSTATVKEINFEAALAAKTFTLSVPAYASAGRAIEVSAVLADKYGNQPAAGAFITFSSTGAGYLNATSATVGRDGKATVRLVFGATETGTAVISATTANTDIVASKRTVTASVTIGTAPAAAGSTTAAIAGSTKRFFVSVSGNSTAKNVVIKVAGKTFKTLKGSTAKKTYLVAAPKGSHKVTVFVGGKLIATKTVSVK